MAAHDFLSTLNGDLRLNQITIPGSHDAGVYAEAAEGQLASTKYAICQDKNINQQCWAGSRFFDVRLRSHGGAVVAHHSVGVGAMRAGSFGGEIGTMMNDVANFLTTNKEEFVILRFTKCAGVDAIYNAVRQHKNKLYTGGGNIANAKLRHLRGKIICVFDKDFRKYYDPLMGIHPFGKYEDGTPTQAGIATCGKYSNNTDMTKVYRKQVVRMKEHDHHPQNDHLHVLYWTQTGGNIEQNTKAEQDAFGPNPVGKLSGGALHTASDLMTDLKMRMNTSMQEQLSSVTSNTLKKAQIERDLKKRSLLKKLGDKLPGRKSALLEELELFKIDRYERMFSGMMPPTLPNVILYDFVNDTTSEQIISLNSPFLRLRG